MRWWQDRRARRELARLASASLGLRSAASQAEILRALRAHRAQGSLDELSRGPWVRKVSEVSQFEIEVLVAWWNVYLLPWRRRELEGFLELTVPAWVHWSVRPCLW